MENNKNSGAFFLNNKDGNEKKPDYTGSLTVEDKKMYVSVWNRTSKSGNDFFSIVFRIPNSDFSIKDPDQENNKGVLFNNNKKSENNKSDMTGKAKINGTNYYLDAIKKSKDGKSFYVFNIKEIGEVDNKEDTATPEDPDNQDHTSTEFNIFTMGQ